MLVTETKWYNRVANKSARDLLCAINLRSKKMNNEQQKISVKELMKEITLFIKDEIVATYTEGEDSLEMYFINGQNFRIKVEEF